MSRNFLVKVNTNIEIQQFPHPLKEEVEKMIWSTRWGRRHSNGFINRKKYS